MTRKSKYFFCLFLILLTFLVASISSAQNLTVRDIMAEPSIAGQRVEGEKLSPDGSKVVYLWNAEGKQPRDLYLVSTNGGTPAKILSPSDLPLPTPSPTPENKLNYGLELRDDFVKARENQIGSVEWSPDSKKLIFSHSGDVYVLTLGEAKPKRYTKTQTPEFGARFLDNNRILYMQGGNVFVLDILNSTVTQLTREANQQTFISVGNVTPNKAGTLVAYIVSDSSKQRALIVPNYLPEFVTAGGPRRGWSDQKLFVTPADGSRETPFEIKLPKHEGVSNFRRMVWTVDGQSLIVDRVDKDTKRRQLFYVHNVGSKAELTILVTEETDDKWQAPLSSIFEPHPKDARQLFFASERDGFNHLYLATLEAPASPAATPDAVQAETRAVASVPAPPSVKIRQLTKGNWQVEWAKWDPRVDQVFFVSTLNGTASRSVSAVDMAGKVESELTTSRMGGMIESPQMGFESVDVRAIFGFSRWNEPTELYAQRLCFGGYVCSSTEPFTAPIPLTRTVPNSFPDRLWTTPKFIDIPSRDGKTIKTKIYLPAGHDPKKKYPMAIFVHGAGYLQNTINGWNNYYREFMFNDLLAKKGYVVLDIDYRGSAGYGRDWRTDVYDFLGGKDYDDHIDAIDHMVKNYGVNQSKIGVYGGSYGGFMAGMLAMRAPERIAAAAALRPVFDWKNYYAANPQYTAQRLGFPDKNPEAYKRSSPITYADMLERPLLILHGMADDNVHVQDSVQLIEKLIRLGKTKHFEAMLYPSENHGFVRPESWTDEYERILALFEKHLK
ncbi:MAG: alpha/beta fold hydrolase [Blastocatellia bacterium]